MQFVAIIPALEKNKYSPNGDLVNWGDSSLLEWKISQAKQVFKEKNIYIVANGNRIKKICEDQNVIFLKRKKNSMYINKLHSYVAENFKNKFIVWLNPTYPFIRPETIIKLIKKFKIDCKKYDSLVSSLNLKEYFFLNNKSINFNYLNKSLSRTKVKKVDQIVNAVLITSGLNIMKFKNLLGINIKFCQIQWLESLEIKTAKDINLFEKLIEIYFE